MKSIRKKDTLGIYYKNEYDQYHKIDGPAIEYSDGTKYFYICDQWHRIDEPARKYKGGRNKYWNIYRQLHRIDGPAREYHTGDKKFFLFHKEYTKEQHQYATEHYDSLTDSNEYFGQESEEQ